MPSYESNGSPSLAKMEYNNGGRYGGAKKFNFGNIVGDPFSLATIGIAIVSSPDTKCGRRELTVSSLGG